MVAKMFGKMAGAGGQNLRRRLSQKSAPGRGPFLRLASLAIRHVEPSFDGVSTLTELIYTSKEG